MKKILVLLFSASFFISCNNNVVESEETTTVSPSPETTAQLEQIRADIPDFNKNPLPKWQTEEEKKLGTIIERNIHVSTPPSGTLYSPAEYAKMEGVVYKPYSNYYDYYKEKTSAIVAAGATPYILVAPGTNQTTVFNSYLAGDGVSFSDVVFLEMDNDAFWSRDFGQWHVYENGQRIIIDHKYYSTRPDDDAVPINIGNLWDEDIYSTALYTEGGNFMTDGLGNCWASTGVLSRNSLSQSEIEDIYINYVGCDNITFVEPVPGEGTTHIDMFSKVLNQDTILVGYSNSSLGATSSEIAHLDSVAEVYRNSPKADGGQWNIVRIPMSFTHSSGWWGSSSNVYYTHTNALVVNGVAMVPIYGRGTDTEALNIWQEALPEYTIIGIDSNDTIPLGGAIHCTTIQVPVRTYSECGNGVIDSGEECEPVYFGGQTCETLGFSGGSLDCNNDCTFNTSNCFEPSVCGDGSITGNETCEPNDTIACTALDAGKYESGTAACQSDCLDWNVDGCVLNPVQNSCESEACLNDTVMSIPDNNATGITSIITVENFNTTIDTVHTTVNITHTYKGDLIVSLTSPEGTSVTLHNRSGGSTNNVNLDLDLTEFSSENPVGDWSLHVSDHAGQDTGTLDNWSLQLTAEAPLLCGNGVVDSGETCDYNDASSSVDCTNLGTEFTGGTATCNTSCNGYDTSTCELAPVCGDNVINGTEVCDGDTVNCTDIDPNTYLSGTAACETDCSGYSTNACVLKDVCGNDVVESGELCDGNAVNCADLDPAYESGTATCDPDCSAWNTNACQLAPVCGNGIVESGEACEGSQTASCSSVGDWDSGTATCSGCQWDESNCTKDNDGWG